jgi:tetratricopeptide (TPR) repeat protein
MHEYGMGDIQRILGIPRAVVRTLIRQNFITPTRGARREYRFSFRDLIVLRIARALTADKIPTKRITRSLRELRRRLPEQAPLSGLSIRAMGDEITVRERAGEWESGSGQYLLTFDVAVQNGSVQLIERPAPPSEDGETLFEHALRQEESDAEAAMQLYQRCLQLDPAHAAARINRGRLLQQAGRAREAEEHYRHGTLEREPFAHFNLGVLLEETGREAEAIDCYQAALMLDSQLADAHYNLARLYELQGDVPNMFRHLRSLRDLQRD